MHCQSIRKKTVLCTTKNTLKCTLKQIKNLENIILEHKKKKRVEIRDPIFNKLYLII